MLKFARAVVLLLILSGSLQGQTYMPFERAQGDGLTNYFIKCIQQDKAGFLWFGSQEGLFRYDGYNFKAFRNFPGDNSSLGNNTIESLYPEEDGMIWVGTRKGLSCIDIGTEKISNFSPGEDLTVYAISPDHDSLLWIGTSAGLFQFNKRSSAWKRTPLGKDIFIRSLSDDRQSNLYVTTHDGFFRYNKITGDHKHFAIPTIIKKNVPSFQIVHKSLIDKEGNLWMSTWNAGLVKFDPKRETLVTCAYPDKKSPSKLIGQQYASAYDLLLDPDGTFLIANNDDGLSLYNPQKQTFENYHLSWDNNPDQSEKTYALFRDRSGLYWMGTQNGIFKYDPYNKRGVKTNLFFRRGDEHDLLQSSPLCMMKDREGQLWIGLYEGLFLCDPYSGELSDCSPQTATGKLSHVFNISQDPAGVYWASAKKSLVKIVRENAGEKCRYTSKTYSSPFIQSVITELFIDKEQRIWLGTHSNGLCSFDPRTEKFTEYPPQDPAVHVNQDEVTCFYELSQDSMLVGGKHIGLLLLDLKTRKYKKLRLPDDGLSTPGDIPVLDIARDDGQNIWIATEGIGLLRTDKTFRSFKSYTIRDGLPSMNISRVLPDHSGHVWMLSNGGIVNYNLNRDLFQVYNKESGVSDLFELAAICLDKNGLVTTGDMGSIHQFGLSNTIINKTPPKVYITGFKIFDSLLRVREDQVVELNYDQNYFSFQYLAISYAQPAHTQYFYQLEGLDTKWNDAGARRYVSYANLKEGRYVFKVRARNNEGIWNESPATLTLIIYPPFWHRWWFYLLIAVFISSVIYGFYFIKRNQHRAREKLRNKIARDLHDDIGSTLSGINIFSKIALQKVYSDQAASGELLKKINERAQKSLEALSDIVWSINTKKDEMDNVLAKMLEHLGEVAEPSGIRYEFIVAEPVYHLHIDMEVRKEIYLIFKEAVNNASKYSACTLIRVELKKMPRSIILSIEDNGKGFDINTIIPGNGINNMQERALKINAGIDISSEPNKGTHILLTLPITRIR